MTRHASLAYKFGTMLLVPSLIAAGAAPGWAASQPGTTTDSGSSGSQPGTTAPQAPLPTPGYRNTPPANPAPSQPAKPKKVVIPKRAIPPKVTMPGPSLEIGMGSYYNSVAINAPVDYAWRWQFNPYGVVVNGASRSGDWGGTGGISLSIRADGKSDIDYYTGTRSGEALTKGHKTIDSPLLFALSKQTEKTWNVNRDTKANQSEIIEYSPDKHLRWRLPMYIQINKAEDSGQKAKPAGKHSEPGGIHAIKTG